LVFALYTTACCGLTIVVGLYRGLWAVVTFVLGIRHACASEFRVGSVRVSDNTVAVQLVVLFRTENISEL